MNLFSEIRVNDEKRDLYKLFKDYEEKGTRSSIKIKNKNKDLIFAITAKDSVALRATLNSITKLLTAYENMEK